MAGVGAQGRGYDQGLVTTPVASYFHAQQAITFDQIHHDLEIFKAINSRYPKSADELKKEILKPANITLPELPAGEHYVYDPETGGLFVAAPNTPPSNPSQPAQASPAGQDPWVGKQMEIAGKTLDGANFDISKYEGRPVLVFFWATWCPYCRDRLPAILDLHDQFHPRGFEIVGISLDRDLKALRQFVRDKKVPWLNLVGTGQGNGMTFPLADKYGVDGIPMTFLLGTDGRVIARNLPEASVSRLLEQQLASSHATESPPLDPKNKDSLDGEWVVTSKLFQGQPTDEHDQIRYKFRGTSVSIAGTGPGGQHQKRCTAKIDPQKSPKEIDFIDPGATYPELGIYEFKDGELRLCLRDANLSLGRPKEFSSQAGSGLMLIVLKRP